MKTFDKQGRIVQLDESASIATLSPMLTWSDAQWADHDAKVAEQKRQDERVQAGEVGKVFRRTSAGFPERAIVAAESAKATAAIEQIKTWKPSERCVLVLSGSPGCGKTVAATHWALHNRHSAVFVRAATFAASSRYERAERNSWLQASALVLDDLGNEYADVKGSLISDLDELVDTYYGDNRPLLITTNLDRESFKARYGQRITDRLRESGKWFSIASESMRGKP
jgi:DNA replication protein DnaC